MAAAKVGTVAVLGEDRRPRMPGSGARGLIVVDDGERRVGILALDDVLELFAEEATSIGKLVPTAAGRE